MIILCPLLLITQFSTAQTGPFDQRPLFTFYDSWNEDTETWTNQDSSSYFANGDTLERIHYEQLGNDEYAPDKRKLNIYTATEEPLKIINQFWIQDTWKSTSQTIYHYNLEELLDTISQQYVNGSGDWVDGELSIYEYDSEGNLSLQLNYNGGTSPDEKITYTYDNNNQLIETLTERWDYYDEWEMAEKATYSQYNEDGFYGKITRSSYSFEYGWTSNRRETFEYNDDNQTTHHLEEWWDMVDQQYYNEFQWIWEYNADGNILEWSWEYGNWSAWSKVRKSISEYHSNGYIKHALHQSGSSDIENVWETTAQTKYFYDDDFSVDVSSSIESNKNIFLFPNLTTGILHFRGIPRGTYQLLDARGRIVDKGSILNEIADISGLPTGIYFIRLNAENGSRVQKILKQ